MRDTCREKEGEVLGDRRMGRKTDTGRDTKRDREIQGGGTYTRNTGRG